jgi:hypothetical protein
MHPSGSTARYGVSPGLIRPAAPASFGRCTRCLVAPAARQASNFNLAPCGSGDEAGPIAFATAAPHQTHERLFTLASAAAAEFSIICAPGDQTGWLL